MRMIVGLLLASVLGVAVSAPYVIPSNAQSVVPLKVGDAMPAVEVHNPDGSPRAIGPGSLQKPTILVFYRGGWCPYCNRHMAALKEVEPDLLKLGYSLVFVSPDKPELLYGSLKDPTVPYTLLSDSTMEAARAYRVAFHVDDAGLAQYKAFGVDLEAASGQTHHLLPVPAVFIIDRAGVIRFVHANPDFTTRIEPKELLQAARSVARSGQGAKSSRPGPVQNEYVPPSP
jgi:peroxiredoxin